jgi:hypothetical protein
MAPARVVERRLLADLDTGGLWILLQDVGIF